MPKVCPVCDTVYADSNAFCPVDGTTLHVVDLEGGLIGSVVADRYLVTDLLGEGGMGKVYLARHVRLPQQAAIKVLRPEMVKDPAAVARFNREASNASRIDDENVARVYDFGEATGGTVSLAMEYVAGRSLRDIIVKDGALEPRRAADLVEQIARGLDAAHRLKIIHRDLKPDNILVVEGPDGREKVKVVDFGIAKAFGAGEGGLTKTGFVVGTPEFMSPEQLLGGALDARSDVYALALVAYQCLTAMLPFGGDTPERSMTARLTSAPKPLAASSGTEWPPAVQATLDAALSRDVEKRPETAGAFARQLKVAIESWDLAPAKAGTSPRTTSPTAAIGKATEKPSSGGSRWQALVAMVLIVVAGAGAAYQFLGNPLGTPAAVDSIAPAASIAASTAAATAGMTQGSAQPSTPSTATARPLSDSTRPLAAVGGASPDSSRQSTSKASAPAPSPKNDPPPAPAAPTQDPALTAQLRNLSSQLKGFPDKRTALGIASNLESLAGKLTDASDRTSAYISLADARALSGDRLGACRALGLARRSSAGSQLSEIQKLERELGCS
ncbi:MAG: serine/threonine protein kinase [Gemmatimonadaceae bacterium]|nr:serine/threonine protein kinase [Gemmatimonadaceae bacterium]